MQDQPNQIDDDFDADDAADTFYKELVGDGRKAVELELRKPIEGKAGEMLETIRFRPLRGRHMRALPIGSIGFSDLFTLAGKMCGLTDSVIDKIEGEDVGRVLGVVGAFLERSLGNGAKT